ncbi:MAG TPA: 50S ribosomal protein L21 [Nitrospirales bacterium]|nr:50S ribosomal protein L21 [Nitrospirales bacterium]
MYAIVETGGKQYRVQPGSVVEFEKLSGDVGGTLELTQVLLIERNGDLTVGRPWVDKARVTGEILTQDRTRSITVFKKKRRKNYRRTKGHRQSFTRVRITDITTA